MLVDASGLIACIDRSDPAHGACTSVIATRRDPVSTTWAALTECLHILRRDLGQPGHGVVLELVERGVVAIVELDGDAIASIAARMRRYADAPMDLADATLVEAAERTGDVEILTLDGHFHAYRLSRGRHLRVLPS